MFKMLRFVVLWGIVACARSTEVPIPDEAIDRRPDRIIGAWEGQYAASWPERDAAGRIQTRYMWVTLTYVFYENGDFERVVDPEEVRLDDVVQVGRYAWAWDAKLGESVLNIFVTASPVQYAKDMLEVREWRVTIFESEVSSVPDILKLRSLGGRAIHFLRVKRADEIPYSRPLGSP